MADEHHRRPPTLPQQGFDHELDYKSIVRFAVGLLVATLIILALMWAMGDWFKRAEEARDRAPPPLPEAREDPIPPGPRLQTTPPRDMDELRAQDQQALTTYGWVDKERGVARIPVDRAMSILVEKGLRPADKKEAK
jgi:hypothetical protein